MGIGLRVRVTWDGAVVEDSIHRGRRAVRIGAGPRVTVVTPADHGRHATVRRLGDGYELCVEPGAADTIEFDGEQPIEARALRSPYRRRLAPPLLGAALTVGGARVEVERVLLSTERRDRALFAWALAAVLLALASGGSYRLVRLFGDGTRAQWGLPALSRQSASAIRVIVGPDAPSAAGASRVQAGRGAALHGSKDAPRRPPSRARPQVSPDEEAAPVAVVDRGRPEVGRGAHPDARRAHAAPRKKVIRIPTVEVKPPDQPPDLPRDQLLEHAEAALLAADLRKAVDAFSRASREAPLSYDQENWLGVAYYLQNDLDEAERTWRQARVLDEHRADAINNLASVALRRGDVSGAIALLDEALAVHPEDCHAQNSLALAIARQGDRARAETVLARSDEACGSNYAYTSIQRAGIRALAGERDAAFGDLEAGLARVDTLTPYKEYEVWSDLTLDPAFASLRADPRFAPLLAKYLPRAAANPPDTAPDAAPHAGNEP